MMVGRSARSRLDPVVVDFARRLAGALRLERLILFGSRARGDHLLTSDYDFIIVSPDFEGQPFVQRGLALYDLWEGDAEFDALCYTPAEFERKRRQLGIVQSAVNEGIEVELDRSQRHNRP